jgi:hypothetical protein
MSTESEDIKNLSFPFERKIKTNQKKKGEKKFVRIGKIFFSQNLLHAILPSRRGRLLEERINSPGGGRKRDGTHLSSSRRPPLPRKDGI